MLQRQQTGCHDDCLQGIQEQRQLPVEGQRCLTLRAASDEAPPLLQRQQTGCRYDCKQGLQEPRQLAVGGKRRLTLQPVRAQPQLQPCHRHPGATLSPVAACCRTPPALRPLALAAEGARRGTAGRAALPHAPRLAFETAATEQETPTLTRSSNIPAAHHRLR